MAYKILLVDDEQMIKLSLRQILTQMHPDFVIVGEAQDGQEALAIIEAEQPHVIITDISMPVMDGLELIHTIHERGWKPTMIILSGYGEFEYAREAMRYGVADYILKPMRPAAVRELMLGLYGKHMAQQEDALRKSEVISQCIPYADELFEHIWMIHEAGVKETTESVLHLINICALPDELKKGVLLDFAAVIRHKAENRGSRLSIELSWKPQLDDMTEQFRRIFLDTMEQVKASRNWGKQSVTQKAIEVIHTRFADPEFKLEELLAQLNLSVTHFYNLFKQETGKTFMTYLIDCRMTEAKKLLGDPTLKTYEVGERVGYPDYPHFTKLFKKVIGLSPGEYRKNMGIH
ncbi:response regulator [Paenibacillus filicis]|uniref:Response regulator n=1 Tax=Paenibacillus filicis TaxID=669464 RepID=A0ABU9DE46_9BACL